MQEKKKLSGVETTFNDKDGNPIYVNSYIKDAEGHVYFVNGHCQAVPDGVDEAPSIELAKLLETSEVSVMSAEEVLQAPKPEERRRRVRRTRNVAEAAPEAEPAKREEQNALSLELVLPLIPDNVLAAELRHRGYTLCAVKPALVTL